MNNLDMKEIYEKRRLALKAAVDEMGRGAIASIAKALDVEPNYLSRCLYPQGKAGKKNIGDELVLRAVEKIPDLGINLLIGIDAAEQQPSKELAQNLSKESVEAAEIVASLDKPDQIEVLHWLRIEAIRRRHS